MNNERWALYTKYAFIATLAAFAAHGLAITVPILNVDDWVHIQSRTPQWGWSQLGRWVQDIVYQYILGSSFSHSAQAIGALLLYLTVPYLLLIRSERTLLSLTALFAAGACYPYWVDALNFSSHVLTFPLALALSAVAFSLACEPQQPAAAKLIALRSLLGGLLFFLALSTYQPLGAFGVIVPLLFALRTSAVGRSQLTRLLVSAGLVVIIGSALYVIAYKGYFAAGYEGVGEDSRAGFANLHILGLKLADLPGRFALTLTGGELGKAHPLFPGLQLSVFFAITLMYLLLLSILLVQKRLLDATRVLLFAPLALTIPVFGPWLIIKVFPWYPPRALAGFNYALGAVFLVLLSELRAIRQWGPEKTGHPRRVFLILLWASAIGATLTSSKLWTDQWRVYQRDIALATTIFSAYSQLAVQEAGRRPKLILVGGNQYRDMFPDPVQTASVARSAFSAPWSRIAIFHELFPGAVAAELRDPESTGRDCDAFPGESSVYLEDNEVVVCLERVLQKQ
jgi:hypothetical protein